MLGVKQIKDILKQERLSISRRRGQNFLVDTQIQKKIIKAIDINPDDEILEIGPGLGALTEDLAIQAAKVVAVEKDRALARVLQQRLSGYLNLQIICQDILQFDIGRFIHREAKVVGNLPYYITTPILGYLLEKQRGNLKEVFITVQEEVGRRMLAREGDRDYSAITVLIRYFTEAKTIFSIPKRAFYPQPKVNSVLIYLRILDRPRIKVNNEEQFFRIIHTCFSQRRKTILNSLTHSLNKIEKGRIQQILAEAAVGFQRRPENLSLDEFARIEEAFYERSIRLE